MQPKWLVPLLVATLLAVSGWALVDRLQIEARVSGNEHRIGAMEEVLKSIDRRLERIEDKLDRVIRGDANSS